MRAKSKPILRAVVSFLARSGYIEHQMDIGGHRTEAYGNPA